MCYLAEFIPETKSWQRDCGRTLTEDRFYAVVHEDDQMNPQIPEDSPRAQTAASSLYMLGKQSQPSCEACQEILQQFGCI